MTESKYSLFGSSHRHSNPVGGCINLLHSLVQAKRGTGKTIAFLIPILQTLLTTAPLPRGQVAVVNLSPTRELALQIAKKEGDTRTRGKG